jgi:hypothetical protein
MPCYVKLQFWSVKLYLCDFSSRFPAVTRTDQIECPVTTVDGLSDALLRKGAPSMQYDHVTSCIGVTVPQKPFNRRFPAQLTQWTKCYNSNRACGLAQLKVWGKLRRIILYKKVAKPEFWYFQDGGTRQWKILKFTKLEMAAAAILRIEEWLQIRKLWATVIKQYTKQQSLCKKGLIGAIFVNSSRRQPNF